MPSGNIRASGLKSTFAVSAKNFQSKEMAAKSFTICESERQQQTTNKKRRDLINRYRTKFVKDKIEKRSTMERHTGHHARYENKIVITVFGAVFSANHIFDYPSIFDPNVGQMSSTKI
uniref:Uncharacterized protein n=1 Tax=Glossina austeni TaxID=7395 RepID=A0A1A9VF82_GLOAU